MTYTFRCNNHKEPLYAYVVQSMMDKLADKHCAQCGEKMVRVYDAAPTHFTGSGWGREAR